MALKGTVARIAAVFRNRQSMYYITPSAGKRTLGTIFTASSDLSEELVLTKAGDKVELFYSDSNTRTRRFLMAGDSCDPIANHYNRAS